MVAKGWSVVHALVCSQDGASKRLGWITSFLKGHDTPDYRRCQGTALVKQQQICAHAPAHAASTHGQHTRSARVRFMYAAGMSNTSGDLRWQRLSTIVLRAWQAARAQNMDMADPSGVACFRQTTAGTQALRQCRCGTNNPFILLQTPTPTPSSCR